MENKHELENLMRSTMENLRDMIDVNTVIGDTIETADGNYIVPISKVSFGFASGGSEFGTLAKRDDFDKYPFGGGSGAGVSVKPVAFLIIRGDSVKLLPCWIVLIPKPSTKSVTHNVCILVVLGD